MDNREVYDKAEEKISSHSVARGMLVSALGNLFSPAAMLIAAPVLAQSLGADQRGAVAGATAPLLLIGAVVTFGVPQTVTYLIARSPSLRRSAMLAGLRIIAVTAVLSTALVLVFRSELSGHNLTISRLMLVASVAIVPTLMLAVLRGVAAGLHRWREIAYERVISATSLLLVVVPLAFLGNLTPYLAVVALSFTPILGAVAYVRMFRDERSVARKRAYSSISSRSMLSYGLRTWIGVLSGVVLSRLDQSVMVPLSDTVQLGLYSVAASISEVPLIVSAAVSGVIYSSDASESQDLRVGAAARISGVASLAIGIIVGLSMIWWLPWLFGREFTTAVPVTLVLILAVVAGTPGSVAGSVLGARGRPGLRSLALVAASLVNVLILLVLVPRFGAMGAAIATLVGNVLASNIVIILVWRVFHINPWKFYGLRRSDVSASRLFVGAILRRIGWVFSARSRSGG